MTSLAGAALLTVVVAGCGTATSPATSPGADTPEPTSPAPTSPGASAGPQLPAGWRWESFGGVQVAVPGEWGWGSAQQRTHQWCINEERDPIVGRPGAVTQVGCPAGEDGLDPGTLLANTGPLVSLEWALDREPGTYREGDRTTVVRGYVTVEVQAEPALREQIAATVHRVAGPRDVYGCPTSDPVWSDPGRRPGDPVDVTTLREVSAVSVCKYQVAPPDARLPGDLEPLLASTRLTGDAAREVVAAIASAPVGGGPDNPGDCVPEYSYGDDLIVLRVASAAGESTVHVRYSGCDHNGLDDGVTVRGLTREVMQPLLAGPMLLSGYSGRGEKQRILSP